MINLKVLSTVAALALVLPLAAAPTASFAQNHGRGGGGAHMGGGARGGGMHMGGGMRTGGQQFNAARVGGGGQQFTGARVSGGSARVGGGGYRYGYRHGGGGFWPGAVAGAVVGGALASGAYGYYGPGYYGGDDYYDNGYADDGAVAVVPGPVEGDGAAYCAQRYRSYDPSSGTYLGYDGLRHPCP